MKVILSEQLYLEGVARGGGRLVGGELTQEVAFRDGRAGCGRATLC